MKKPFLLSEEWVLAVGQPRYPISLGSEALRPTLWGGLPFSYFFLMVAVSVPKKAKKPRGPPNAPCMPDNLLTTL
jgi:hypothetical protein